MSNITGPSPEITNWLNGKSSLLVLTHERPDGDAIGSMAGLILALAKAGKKAIGYLQEPVPTRYQTLLSKQATILTGATHLPLEQFDGIVCVDTTGLDRLVSPCPVQDLLTCDICNIDHHQDNTGFGNTVWIEKAAATAELLTTLTHQLGCLTPPAATAFMAGLIMDTGGFRFPNTNSQAMQTAALLMDNGADYELVMDQLFFREKHARRLLESEILQNATFRFDNRLAYAVLRPERVQSLGLDPAELEGLIDILRSIDTVEIACLIQPQADCMRFSLRARSARYPVSDIARALGGGGHLLAAGAKQNNLTLSQAENLLIQLAEKVLNHHEPQ